MKSKKILFIGLLAVCMLFAGCQKKTEGKESGVSRTKQEKTVKTTPAPTKRPTKAPTPTVTAKPAADSANANLLTGQDTLSQFAIGKRPVAVMVDNVTDALPQYGLSAADLVFEAPVEGDLTRLMALYGDLTKIPNICPVRSCRYYFPILAVGYDAFYAHWGMDDTIARDTLNSLDIDSMDGMDNDFLIFGRDQERINSGISREHTAYFEGTKFADLLGAQRLELKAEKKHLAFAFQEKGKKVPAAGEAKNQVVIDFGASATKMNYDATSDTYLMHHNDAPQMDAHTNKQLSFTNVIVLETDISVRDDVGRKNVNWKGGPQYNGYYISGGHVQKIHWSKSDEYAYLKLTDESNQELRINRGKSYIALDYPGRVTFG